MKRDFSAGHSRVRDHIVKLRLSERENDVIEAIVKRCGGKKAELIREMVLKQVAEKLKSVNP